MISAEWYAKWSMLDYDLWTNKKLLLVCDIDNNIVDSTTKGLGHLPERTICFTEQETETKTVNITVKLRPFLEDFLHACIDIGFELVVYSQGDGNYVNKVLNGIDSEGKLFKHRYIARARHHETKEILSKSLKRLPLKDRGLCLVLDDRSDVWAEEDQPYLIQTFAYRYLVDNLASTNENKTWPNDCDNVLKNLIPVMRMVHHLVYHGDFPTSHTAHALARIKATVLQNVVFQAEDLTPKFLNLAKTFGATVIVPSEDGEKKQQQQTAHLTANLQVLYAVIHYRYSDAIPLTLDMFGYASQSLDYDKTLKIV